MANNIVLKAVCVMAVVSLSGCKIEMSSPLPLSGLFGAEIQKGVTDLYVEVPACDNYEDSRQPSKSLLDTKNEVSGLFPDGEFKECFKKQLQSYAHFTVPYAYGPDKLVTKDTPQIRILYNEAGNAYFAFGPELKGKLTKLKNKPAVYGGFAPTDLSIVMKVTNDTNKVVKASFMSTWINMMPVVNASLVTIPAGEQLMLRLSDVSSAVLFEQNENNRAWFMSNITW